LSLQWKSTVLTLPVITYTAAAAKLMQNAGWEIKTFIFLSVIFFISHENIFPWLFLKKNLSCLFSRK